MNKTDAINCIQDIIDVANSHGSAYVYSRNGGVAQLENVLECLKNSEPVRHGHWWLERTPDGAPYAFHCSACDKDGHSIGNISTSDYCPDCGARMDEEAV